MYDKTIQSHPNLGRYVWRASYFIFHSKYINNSLQIIKWAFYLLQTFRTNVGVNVLPFYCFLRCSWTSYFGFSSFAATVSQQFFYVTQIGSIFKQMSSKPACHQARTMPQRMQTVIYLSFWRRRTPAIANSRSNLISCSRLLGFFLRQNDKMIEKLELI